jgi:hypothetical protein
MTDKKEIAELLKKLGLGNVKMHGVGYNSFGEDTKVYKSPIGKMVKAIKGGSIGPMTVTDAHMDLNEKVVNELTSVFLDLGICERIKSDKWSLEASFQISASKKMTLYFHWDLFPTYTREKNLDPGYKTYWFVLTKKESKL